MTRTLVLALMLSSVAVRAEDGGLPGGDDVLEVKSGVVVLPSDKVRSIGASICLEESAAIERARELASLRVEVQEWRRRALAAPVCSPQPSTIGATTLGALAVLAASLVPLFFPR